jgi:hypothetical protein
MSHTNQTQKTSPVGGWRLPLTMGLAIGLGIPLGRYVVAALWPDLDGSWGTIAVNAVSAGLIGGIVAGVVSWLFKPVGKHLPDDQPRS